MAANGQFMSFLDSNQQDLLTAALNSNSNQQQNTNGNNMGQQFGNNPSQFSFEGMDPSLFMNTNNLAMQDLNNFGAINDSPFLDYADNDANFDFENFNDADGQMIGNLPDDENDDEEDDDDNDNHDGLHDKRKSPDDKEDNENGGKRREGEVKEPKKPGRKPLTSEPTNKRKAQNRAAQRAFRERKEKHLKDLETKVTELEKASEAANHENGLLRAQVDRLQIELREYRKRLSQNTGLIGRSPPMGANMFLPNVASTNSNNNFQFEFPKFGSLPGGVFGTNNNLNKKVTANGNTNGVNGANAALARNGSTGRSLSPRSQARANGSFSSEASPRANGSVSSNAGTPDQSNNSVSSVFTPASFNGQTGDGSLGFESWFTTTTSAEPESITSGQRNGSRIFQFNSSNNSTASPGSSSSLSQYGGGPNSSCGTSPEPSHNSPKTNNLDTITECSTIQTSDGEITFCDKLNMACGTIRNPIPRTKSQQSDGITSAGANAAKATADKTTTVPVQKESDFNFFAALANQNGGGFDPQLFDTYREPQNAIVGDGDFTGGFFNDAMPAGDFSSPFDWANITAPTGLTPFVSKQNPLEMADALQAGIDEDEVVPADNTDSMLTCHKIWDKLQDRPDFKDGSLDIDGLCSELRAKARCSESGVVIDQKDVDSALKRLSPPATKAAISAAPIAK